MDQILDITLFSKFIRSTISAGKWIEPKTFKKHHGTKYKACHISLKLTVTHVECIQKQQSLTKCSSSSFELSAFLWPNISRPHGVWSPPHFLSSLLIFPEFKSNWLIGKREGERTSSASFIACSTKTKMHKSFFSPQLFSIEGGK